ncbi:MAG TPA: DUF4410 domain-containing protein [Paraburkholderia sp.]|uniref:DUF4410 domain-containing protein n=1 Tax=Paraburkholderia sp. TaxID=1926495 RepID=UPI002DE32746|nr:DUF4410 domain-containing protein [Paraburkholderia sp.]
MNDRRKFCMATLALAASPVFAQQTAGNAGIVYVSDFELDDASVTADQNPVDNARRLAGGLLPRPLLRRDKTGTRASDIVEQMAQALVADLRRAGLDARRLPAGATPPAQGWLVRGVFLDVDEGNRLRRAIVGFGAGANEVDLAVAVDDLSKQTPAPLYQVVESRSSASKPGAGAAIALNPYVAAAKFVMARGDQRKTVDRAASEVSDAVLARVKSAP